MSERDRERVRRYVARLDRARATLASELADDVDPVRDLTLRERGAWIASACRASWAILVSRPDADRVIVAREAPAPDFAAKWSALMARHRRCRATTPS